MIQEPSTSEKTLFIKMAVSAWDTQNARVTKLIDKLSDEQILSETGVGRNSGFYLLGHLTSVSDGMLPLLGWGDRLYPQLNEPFLKNPEKAGSDLPTLAQLKEYWQNINAQISTHISKMTPDDWFTRHTAVSAEDFEKEPLRNKLNLLINRTNHVSYHLGQMIYLSPKE